MNPIRWCARWRTHFSLVSATALLAACATVSTAPPILPAPAFDMSGRLAVRSQAQAFSSMVRWTQQGGHDELWLITPLGQSVAYLSADSSGATLTTADNKQYRAASVESLTQRALGWRLPVAPLRYWLHGSAAPWLPQSATDYDAQQRLLRLTQGEWRVTFHYAEADPQRVYPARLEVSGGAAELKLVIDKFETIAP